MVLKWLWVQFMIRTVRIYNPKRVHTESSDEDFPTLFKRPDNDIIMAEFPENMLTSEVRTCVTNCLDHMEQSHSAAAAALSEAKKLMPVIPVGSFRLLLHVLLQPVIKLNGQCVWRVTKMPKPKGFSFTDMLPKSSEAHNLQASSPNFCSNPVIVHQRRVQSQSFHPWSVIIIWYTGETAPPSCKRSKIWVRFTEVETQVNSNQSNSWTV